jgi:hypothetical protein
LPAPLDGAVQASEVSLGDDLEHVDMQHLIGDDPLQSSILVLERAHLRDVADFHAAELRLPFVKGRRADSIRRQISAVFTPASDSLMMPTIWASVNRDLRIWATPCGQLPREFALIAGILSWAQVNL